MVSIVAKLLALGVRFFGPSLGSINGTLIVPELKKILALALAASTIAGGAAAAFAQLAVDAPVLLTSPFAASLATLVLTALADALRRLPHGSTPGLARRTVDRFLATDPAEFRKA